MTTWSATLSSVSLAEALAPISVENKHYFLTLGLKISVKAVNDYLLLRSMGIFMKLKRDHEHFKTAITVADD